MPNVAKHVTLDLAQKKLFVDGQEFPWLITEDGPHFDRMCQPRAMKTVTLTFYTEDVEVVPERTRQTEAEAAVDSRMSDD